MNYKESSQALLDNYKQFGKFPFVPLRDGVTDPFWNGVKWGDDSKRIHSPEECTVENAFSKYKYSPKQITGGLLITGSASGVMVVDVDVNHDKFDKDGNPIEGSDGLQAFRDAFGCEPLDIPTYAVRTPSGGYHLYFKYKKGLKNNANYFPGVDIRTDGGCIVMPGTWRKKVDRINEDGSHTYKSEGYYRDIEGHNEVSQICDMPSEMFEKLEALVKLKKSGKGTRSKKSRNNKSVVKSKSAFGEVDGYRVIGRNMSLFNDMGVFMQNSRIRNEEDVLMVARALNAYRCEEAGVEPLPDREVEAMVDQLVKHYNYPEYCDQENGKVINSLLADKILAENPSYSRGNIFFVYDEKEGYYIPKDVNEIKKMFLDYTVEPWNEEDSYAEKFAKCLLLKSGEKEKAYDEKRYICLGNGLYDLESDSVVPYTPDVRLETKFKPNYREFSEEEFYNTKFYRFLRDVFPTDPQTIGMVGEMIGLIMSPHAQEAQRAYFLYGDGSNGKSVLIEIIRALFKTPKKSICQISLSNFDDQFVVASAEGTHANIYADDQLTPGMKVGSLWKSFIAGDSGISINQKYQSVKNSVEFNMTHIFGLNNLPNTSDKTEGFYRRACIIPFKVKFGYQEEIDAGEADKLRNNNLRREIPEDPTEMEAVVWFAIQWLHNLKKNNWKPIESDEAKQIRMQYKLETNSAEAFYQDCIHKDERSYISLKDLYNHYLNYCEDEYIPKPLSKNNFDRRIREKRIESAKTTRGGKNGHFWLGIAYQNPDGNPLHN